MKYLNTKLSSLTLLCLIIVLSSCSQQRYSSRAYSKSSPVVSNEVKKAPKTAVNRSAQEEVADIPATSPEATETIPVQAQVEPITVTPNQLAAKAKTTEAPKSFNLKNKVAKHAATKAVKQLKKATVLDKEDANGDISMGNKWVRIFIIGLIILLIGILLPGGIGYIFYLVGSIIMLVALIFFLIELL